MRPLGTERRGGPTAGVVSVAYPETACPLCEQRPGTLPGVCHLLPTEREPVSVLIHFRTCGRCDRRMRNAAPKAHAKLSRETVRFFDQWLELEYGPKRAAA